MKKIVFIFLILVFSKSLFAHKIEGMDLTIKRVEDNKILIEGFNKRTKEKLDGNKIKLFSMVNNKVLFEGFLNKGSLTTFIPTTPYSVYMYVGSLDVVIEGIPPKDGFSGIYASKKDRVFFYTLFMSLLLVFLGILMFFKKRFDIKIFKIK